MRRLSATIKEQLKVAYPNSEAITTFTVKFKNGSISEPATIDEIFSQENRGSEAIMLLTMKECAAQDLNCAIEVNFTSELDDDKGKSISYKITHNDKDWVFVTNSKIDERISRIRRISVSSIYSNRIFLPTAIMIFMFIATIIVSLFVAPNENLQHKEIIELSKQYAHDKSYAVIDFLVKQDAIHSAISGVQNYLPVYLIIGVVIALVALVFLIRGIEYLFPSYNYLWGDYIEVYKWRRNLSYIIFVGIILAVIVAIIANIISGRLLNI